MRHLSLAPENCPESALKYIALQINEAYTKLADGTDDRELQRHLDQLRLAFQKEETELT